MSSQPSYRIECHPSAATLYMAGPLTVAAASCAARLFDNLPPAVTHIRVDLTGARMTDPTPLQAIAMTLARWRRLGHGRHARLDLPPASRRPRPVLPSAISPRTPRTRPRRVRRAAGSSSAGVTGS